MLAEIDLSAGQVFLFAPWVEYWMHNLGVPIALSIVIALIVVAGVGAVNGLITVLLNVPSFVTTLAMNFILFGLVLIYSDQTQATPIPLSQYSSPNGTVSFASQVMGAWLWAEILWVIAITIVVHVLLTRTRFGVRVIASGGNLVGAAEAGVPVRRVKVMAFVLCSLIAGFVGIIDAVKYGSLDPGNFGVDYILYAVGACVIGGTALTGGRGTVIGAFIGAILIGILEDGLTLVGISTNDFYVWVGVVIIFAMALNVQFDRLIARSRGT
jgi:simple sugar transport system permease protein